MRRDKPSAVRILTVFLAVASAATAVVAADLTGTWSFDTTMNNDAIECHFHGIATIVEDGSSNVTGYARMQLSSGDPGCPFETEADITGTHVGDKVELSLDGGALGVATLSGLEDGGGSDVAGEAEVDSGPFVEMVGLWSALRVPTAIPTLGIVGGVALILLLAGAAGVSLRLRAG